MVQLISSRRYWICLWLFGLVFGVESKDILVVNIPGQGQISGKEVSLSRAQKATVYLGIPFAQSPTQPRLAPPIVDPLPSWPDVKNASSFAPACPQDKAALREHEYILSQILSDQIDALEFSEDCLYLNIFVPDGPVPPEKWPVVVWFHPGNFSVGATALWDGSALAMKQKVIIVTPAYRLNVLGFFALDGGTSPGNYGLLDRVAALKWINDKISEFGGSQDDICIMGHGAGATSVGLHMVSPLSEGKFNRAIAMSGSAFSNLVGTIPDIQAYKDIPFVACEDTKTNKDLFECIKIVGAMQLVKESWNSYPWGPVIDNVSDTFLPKSPLEYFDIQKYHKVDFLTGFTDMEDALEIDAKVSNSEKGISFDLFKSFIQSETESEYEDVDLVEIGDSNQTCAVNVDHLADTILFYYTPYPSSVEPEVNLQKYVDYTTDKKYGAGIYRQAQFISKSSKTYVYRFDYRPKKSLVDLPEWIHVPHGFELPFFWGMPYWPSLSHIIWNGADRKVADIVMSLWTNFAKYGNPIQTGINYKWDAFEETAPSIMIMDRNFNMSDPSTFDHKAFAFWVDYYPKVVAATQCCNVTQNGLRIHGNPTLTGILVTLAGIQYLLTS